MIAQIVQSNSIKSGGRVFDLPILTELIRHTNFTVIDENTAAYKALGDPESNKDSGKFLII